MSVPHAPRGCVPVRPPAGGPRHRSTLCRALRHASPPGAMPPRKAASQVPRTCLASQSSVGVPVEGAPPDRRGRTARPDAASPPLRTRVRHARRWTSTGRALWHRVTPVVDVEPIDAGQCSASTTFRVGSRRGAPRAARRGVCPAAPRGEEESGRWLPTRRSTSPQGPTKHVRPAVMNQRYTRPPRVEHVGYLFGQVIANVTDAVAAGEGGGEPLQAVEKCSGWGTTRHLSWARPSTPSPSCRMRSFSRHDDRRTTL